MTNTKKSYCAPKLTVHGDVEVLTQAIKLELDVLDLDYPANTPREDLTFT